MRTGDGIGAGILCLCPVFPCCSACRVHRRIGWHAAGAVLSDFGQSVLPAGQFRERCDTERVRGDNRRTTDSAPIFLFLIFVDVIP